MILYNTRLLNYEPKNAPRYLIVFASFPLGLEGFDYIKQNIIYSISINKNFRKNIIFEIKNFYMKYDSINWRA